MKQTEKATHLPHVCPYIGLVDDDGTMMLYASDWNCCYRCKPVQAIEHSHQQISCLTPDHVNCPAYKAPEGLPLPADLRLPETAVRKRSRRRRPLLLWLIPIGVLLMLFAGVWTIGSRIGFRNIASQIGVPLPATNTPVADQPTVAPSGTPDIPTMTPTFVPTDTPILNTPEPVSSIPTRATLLRLPDMVFGSEFKFMIHIVSTGDSFEILASRNSTTPQAILAVNRAPRVPTRAGEMLVIPVGFSDVSTLPTFDIYKVPETISLSELARQQSVDLKLLATYNDISELQIISPGTWVILPR